MNSDLTFITNDSNQTLKERFEVLIKDSKFFDCLTAYFYISGFHMLYKSLENTDKIRILIGMNTNKETYELIKGEIENLSFFSHREVKDNIENDIIEEFNNSDDGKEVEAGIQKFIEWIKSKKIEIRAYPSHKIHAKLYIMTFKEGDRDIGRVITGSSNFTYSGLQDNLEFNVELKNRSDYEFAKQKFEELWNDSVDVSEKFVQTIEQKTWFSQNISPYELYLKFLYEYFRDELNTDEEIFVKYLPENFKRFEYQEQAVINAKKILEEYGGVFISDVVGLGKTYIATMLAGQLDGRTLVIAPPALIDKRNPGSWPNAFVDFHISGDFESIGKLDDILKKGTDKYKNIIIDEAHRFRSETTVSYEKLAEICRGKRVILVTATPYNNSPKDILAQIKLFQNPKKSTIPNLPDLESFFTYLDSRLKKIDREKNYEKYLEIVKENAKEIRERVLKYLMVRRTRTEIEKYFKEDMEKQNIKFPEVKDPISLYYQLNKQEDEIFMETVELITKKFKYSRYTPLLYYKNEITELEKQSQKNMGSFMKVLLIKRLESSFYAFKCSIDRFITSYEMFINEFKKGNVYVSKKHINKIFELLENDDDDAEIQKLIDEGKAERYNAKDFREEFLIDLENDFEILLNIKAMWSKITRDPKLETLIYKLKQEPILTKNKLIIFTESKETANYLAEQISKNVTKKVLLFTGSSGHDVKERVIENFDARVRYPKDDYRILISTEVLSEGVNLHRSNVVINYDIPWNPTRMMQRVGRVNRIDTTFATIYTFNFFPTVQAESEIELTKIARSKIEAFLTILGGDASILTEGEPVTSHELFNRLTSKKTIIGEEEEESELKYLRIIKEIRDNQPELFEKIKRLPKKARTAKIGNVNSSTLITYFRKGKLDKFYKVTDEVYPEELDFTTAAKYLESNINEKKEQLPENFYELLEKNKNAFIVATSEEFQEINLRKNRGSVNEILKILKITLKQSKQFTEDQEEYLRKIITQIEEGAIPKGTIKKALNVLKELKMEIQNPLKVIAVLKTQIPERFLESHYVETSSIFSGKREVILSMYLKGV